MTAITYKQLREDASIRTYIIRADESLLALGFTEHSFAHVTMVSENAAHILETLGYSEQWSLSALPAICTISVTL